MSFSSTVKNEVAKYKVEGYDEMLCEMAGLSPMCGVLTAKGGKLYIRYQTENASVARRIFTFLKRFFDFDISVAMAKSTQLKKHLYIITLDDYSAAQVLLSDMDFIHGENVFIPNYCPESLVSSTQGKKAYIRGAFLGSGSIVNPEKSYHLEFVCNNEIHAEFLAENVNFFGLCAKVTQRKEKYIVYLKEAEQISDLLSVIGAYRSLLSFENVRVIKEMRNRVNRLVNCETANLNKTVGASLEQVKNIEYIQEHLGLEKLLPQLQETAALRLEYPDASLKDLAQMASPKVSKSTMNYRLSKLKEIANKMRSEQNG